MPTYRDVEVDRSHPLSGTLAELRRAGSFARVLLRGLTPDEVHRMIAGIAGQEPPWGLAEAVHRSTEGNPLFVQEVLRYLVEEGMLAREGGRWQRTGEEPLAQRIPEGLRDVIGKRLSRLSRECNRLLSVAAVIGRDFRLDTLQAVARAQEEEVVSGLEEAMKVGVLEDRSQGGLVRLRFAHAFFRQTLYEELFAPRRIRLHRQIDDTEALFSAAFELIQTPGGPQRLGDRLRLAEEFAARPRGGVSTRTLAMILNQIGNAYLASGERAREEDIWRQLAELATRTHDPYVILSQIVREATLATLDGRLEEALAAGDHLAAGGEELGSPVFGRQFASMVRTQPWLYQGRGEQALAASPQATSVAGVEGLGPHQAANQARILAHLGRQTEAREGLRESMARLGIGPEEDETPPGTLNQCLETAVLVEDREAAALLSSRLAGVSRWCLSVNLTCVARQLGAAAALLGESEKAHAYYQQALEVCAKIRFRPEIALTRLGLAELLLAEAEKKGKGGPHPSPLPEGEGELRREALGHLDFAIAEFREMKMQPSLERALRHKELLRA